MNDDKLAGRLHGPQHEPETEENILSRIVYMVILWIMLSVANTILTGATLLQLVIMLLNNKRPNERLADFGTDLGVWIAKAARYQTGASDVKPWPWTELD